MSHQSLLHFKQSCLLRYRKWIGVFSLITINNYYKSKNHCDSIYKLRIQQNQLLTNIEEQHCVLWNNQCWCIKIVSSCSGKIKTKVNEQCKRTTDDALVLLTAEFVRMSILAAAAAGEAGHDIKQQMSYLKDAEQAAVPSLSLMSEIRCTDDGNLSNYFIDQLVDLYNNKGIAIKKHGSRSRNHAQEYFTKL